MMINKQNASISKCIIHKVGNKYNSGHNVFSTDIVKFDEDSYDVLLPFLLKPFTTLTQSYRFSHGADIRLNTVNKNVSEIFEDSLSFVNNSANIVNHLFEQSNSASIKTGDVLIVHFEGLQYKDTLVKAVGIFKIENKTDFFQTYSEQESFDMVVQKGISTKKLDKGCLVLDSTDAEGAVVLSVDNNNYDAQYWVKNFLDIQFAEDKNLHTQQFLHMCKDFSDEVVRPEKGNKARSSFLSDTVDYFKENEQATMEEFKAEVLGDENYQILFKEYVKDFENENDVKLRNSFEISEEVFKKEKKKFKAEIKLDTNIQIKVDIDAPTASAEYLEQGYDEDKRMKYYKIFYNSEK